jgi:hypothetical protein
LKSRYYMYVANNLRYNSLLLVKRQSLTSSRQAINVAEEERKAFRLPSHHCLQYVMVKFFMLVGRILRANNSLASDTCISSPSTSAYGFHLLPSLPPTSCYHLFHLELCVH